ncbi:threonyl-trna synthetase [Methylobacterium sp. GXS13]|uniref:hypothetical protein n=1 Tax=Methylobacterium sp. GXS13 TaxID=1730094 RepID=UPI00071C0F16|nr:hypothetical protein [Methylobacterium sp. GXS13]KST61151.1 threonyl-trna synthetase [Methylobacterium sp. GXS13]
MPRRAALALALGMTAWTGIVAAADASGEGAPFGLVWGPVDRIAPPSMVDREANLTGLFYFHDRPLASGPDTAEVILVVCQEQGLQQVVWVGRPLDDVTAASAWERIRREGMRRHGEPRTGPGANVLEWPEARTTLAMRLAADGTRTLVMTVSGPRFAACSDVHRAATGHPAEAHVADLLGATGP